LKIQKKSIDYCLDHDNDNKKINESPIIETNFDDIGEKNNLAIEKPMIKTVKSKYKLYKDLLKHMVAPINRASTKKIHSQRGIPFIYKEQDKDTQFKTPIPTIKQTIDYSSSIFANKYINSQNLKHRHQMSFKEKPINININNYNIHNHNYFQIIRSTNNNSNSNGNINLCNIYKEKDSAINNEQLNSIINNKNAESKSIKRNIDYINKQPVTKKSVKSNQTLINLSNKFKEMDDIFNYEYKVIELPAKKKSAIASGKITRKNKIRKARTV